MTDKWFLSQGGLLNRLQSYLQFENKSVVQFGNFVLYSNILHTSSSGMSIRPTGTVFPVLVATKTRCTLGHCFTAWSTVVLRLINLPPLTAWSEVIIVSAPATKKKRRCWNATIIPHKGRWDIVLIVIVMSEVMLVSAPATKRKKRCWNTMMISCTGKLDQKLRSYLHMQLYVGSLPTSIYYSGVTSQCRLIQPVNQTECIDHEDRCYVGQ